MKNNENQFRIRQIACEGLIRRFAESHHYFPFMLKGSFLTRQYFPKQIERKPQDLDWVCLKPLLDRNLVQDHLNQWMHYLTHVECHDGIRYEAFAQDSYWWELEYVMSEDFPTVSTVVFAWVDGQRIDVDIDVSFNIQIQDIETDLVFHPFNGKDFRLKQTPSLATQIAWKLHQCMVNPRYKDIFDLTYLLKHQLFMNDYARISTIQTLKNECVRDGIELLEHLHQSQLILADARRALSRTWKSSQQTFSFTDPKNIPDTFEVFWDNFMTALIHSDLLQWIE